MDRDKQGKFAPKNTIARKGFQAMVDAHFGGDRKKAIKWFTDCGLWVQDSVHRESGLGIFPDPGIHPAWKEQAPRRKRIVPNDQGGVKFNSTQEEGNHDSRNNDQGQNRESGVDYNVPF